MVCGTLPFVAMPVMQQQANRANTCVTTMHGEKHFPRAAGCILTHRVAFAVADTTSISSRLLTPLPPLHHSSSISRLHSAVSGFWAKRAAKKAGGDAC